MAHWSDGYIGRSYEQGTYDCASLAVDVMRDVFNKEIPDYGERPPLRSAAHAWLEAELYQRTRRLDVPREGCAVQIAIEGRIKHVGIYCKVDGTPSVLHNIRKHGVVRTRVADMPKWGWNIEGYYEWI